MRPKVILVFSFIIMTFTAARAQQYEMTVENVKKISNQEYEFDVFIKSGGINFELQAYQAALSVDAASINGGTLTFQYIPNSSELNNPPSFGTGIYNFDGITEAAFASGAERSDIISQTKKRTGRFRLLNSKQFAGVPDLKWDFSGNVNTIVARTGFANITNPSSHSVILNEAPVFTAQLSSQTITTADTLKFTYTASDVNNDQLTYSVSAEPVFQGSINIDQTGKLVLIPSLSDGGKTFIVTASVTDNRSAPAAASASVTIQKINHAPVFISVLNDNEITVGDTLQFIYAASDQDNDQISYSLYSVTPAVNGKISLSSTSGEFSFIPTDADSGKIFSVIIKANDGEKEVYSSAANIKVNGVQKINHAPEFRSVLSAVNVTIGDTLRFNYSAIDTDNDTPGFAIYSVEPSPRGEMSINSSTGRFRFIPLAEDTGKTFTVVIEVSDWAAAVYSQPAYITVKGIQKINNKPVFTSVLPHSELTAGENISFNYSASDADGDTLQYTLHSITPDVSGSSALTKSGLFSFIPNDADTGKTFSVIVKVNDGKDTVFSPAANIKVKGIPKINNKPVFSAALKDTSITAGDTLLFTYSAADIDADVIEYGLHSVTPSPAGEINIDHQSGRLRFIPAEADTSFSFSVIVSASDGIDTVTTVSAEIFVQAAEKNNPPAFSYELSDTVITEGDTLEFVYRAEDADEDAIVFALHEVSPQAAGSISINAGTGLFSFIPSVEDTGKTFIITLSVNDGIDTSYSTPAEINVKAKQVNNPPVFVSVMNDTSVTAGDSLAFTYTAGDADGEAIEFMLHSISPSFNGRAAVDESSGKFTFTPFIADSGKTFSVVIGLNDGKDTVYSNAVKIKVNGVKKNSPPEFTAALSVVHIFPLDTVRFKYAAKDADGDELNYSLNSFTPSIKGSILFDENSGELIVVPAMGDAGRTFFVSVSVTDGRDTVVSADGIIAVQKKNSRPVINQVLQDTIITTADTLKFKFTSDDADGDNIKYKLINSGSGLEGKVKLDSLTGMFTLIPAEDDAGTNFTFSLAATDGIDTVYSPEIEIKITEPAVTAVDDENNLNEFSLFQNYPNPFNPSTKIRFRLPAGINGNVTLEVFDILGNKLTELMNEVKPQGEYEIEFNASSYASGIYIYRLAAENLVQTRVMQLVK